MTQSLRRITTEEHDGVMIVRLQDGKIIDRGLIEELGEELYGLVEIDGRRLLIVDFGAVHFFASTALNKLIILSRKMERAGGKLRFCSMSPEIYEVFAITRLKSFFDIKSTLDEALHGFS